MKVKDLKELLQDFVERLDQFEDQQDIKIESNTYFLEGARYFLGVAGSDGGYINLEHIEEVINDDEDEGDFIDFCEEFDPDCNLTDEELRMMYNSSK